jgi:hypothetical protein
MAKSLLHFADVTKVDPYTITLAETSRSKVSGITSIALEAIESWDTIETAMLELYIYLLNGHEQRVAKTFLAVEIFETKLVLLKAAASEALSANRLNSLVKLMGIARKAKRKRDFLAQARWCESEQIRDAVLVIAPSREDWTNASPDNVLVYTRDDLENLVSENTRISDCFRNFQRLHLLEGDPMEANKRLIDWVDANTAQGQ